MSAAPGTSSKAVRENLRLLPGEPASRRCAFHGSREKRIFFVARAPEVSHCMTLKLRKAAAGLALAAALPVSTAVAQANADPGVKHIRNIADGPQNKVTAQMLASGVRTCTGRVD